MAGRYRFLVKLLDDTGLIVHSLWREQNRANKAADETDPSFPMKECLEVFIESNYSHRHQKGGLPPPLFGGLPPPLFT